MKYCCYRAINSNKFRQADLALAGLTVRKMELGWLTGYTKLTDYADFGTMLIYITGDNRQSLIMLCDIQRVIM